MDKYEYYDYHPRNQHVRRRDGMWRGRSEGSEFFDHRNSPVALIGTVGTRAEGTALGCQHPKLPQSLPGLGV